MKYIKAEVTIDYFNNSEIFASSGMIHCTSYGEIITVDGEKYICMNVTFGTNYIVPSPECREVSPASYSPKKCPSFRDTYCTDYYIT